jgi:O-methyltransferase involved in polyketide biosynthesis
MKIKLEGVSETLLIPLWARAVETKRPDAILRDELAVQLVEGIDYDFSKFNKAWRSQTGVAIRSELLDREVKAFITNHPESVIINLGCGLDTRFFRVDNQKIHWYDLDLPEPIQVRKRFFDETDRYRMISASVFDFSWMEQVDRAGRPVLLIAEGLFMYFEENEVKRLFHRLAETFPSAEMLLEVMPPLVLKMSKMHDTVGKMGLEFKWGIAWGRELEPYDPRIQVMGEWNFFDFHPKRWKGMRWLALIPVFKNNFNDRIVHLRFLQQ